LQSFFFILPALCGASSVAHILELFAVDESTSLLSSLLVASMRIYQVIPGSAVLGMQKITGLTGFPCWQHRQHPCTSYVRTAELRAGRNLHVVRRFMTTFG